MTTTHLRHHASLLRTMCMGLPFFRDGYIVSFDDYPKDSVTIYRRSSDDIYTFGLHLDDPYMSMGIDEDEAMELISNLLAIVIEDRAKWN